MTDPIKRRPKWFALISLLILAVLCVDLNLRYYRFSSVSEEVVDIVNSVTLSLLLIWAIRYVNNTSRSKTK
jgi:hypothetical protein